MRTAIQTIATLLMACTLCYGAAEYHPNNAYFSTNVYLSDDTNTPLHARIPTGASISLNDGGYVNPATNLYTFWGNMTLETNREFKMWYKPAVDSASTGVILNANGTLTLRKYVTGTGWVSYTLDPTNPPLTATCVTSSGLDSRSATATVSIDSNDLTGVLAITLQSTNGAGIYNRISASGANADVSKITLGADPYGATDLYSFYKTYADFGGKPISNAVYNGTFAGDGSSITNLPAQPVGGTLSQSLNGDSYSITNVEYVRTDYVLSRGVTNANNILTIGTSNADGSAPGNWPAGSAGDIHFTTGETGSDYGAIVFEILGSGGINFMLEDNAEVPFYITELAPSIDASLTNKQYLLWHDNGVVCYGTNGAPAWKSGPNIILDALPESDPGISNAIWKAGSNLYISNGP